MASANEDNKRRFQLNMGEQQESRVVVVYKKLEMILNNKSEPYTKKVESLIEVWRQVSEFQASEYKQYMIHLMDWLKLHTLNIVLNGDWKLCKERYETILLAEVNNCEIILRNSNSIFSTRCKKLADIIKQPWGNSILINVLNNEIDVGRNEMELFATETGYLISTRLRKLCESRCEDLALNLVTAFMKCQKLADDEDFNLNATEDQKRFILDIYIALLYKFKRYSDIIVKLKTLPLQEGVELLQRFSHKRVSISKIWRSSAQIANLTAYVFLLSALMQPASEDNNRIIQQLLHCWLNISEITDDRETMITAIRKIVLTAESAVPMYIFCWALYKKFGAEMQTFVIELFVRTLNTDINNLEKEKQDDNKGKVIEITKRLSQGFLRLGEVLDAYVKVSRECLLTSFSLYPTHETLDKIVSLAQRSGLKVLDTGQEWKCKLHPPCLPSDEVCWKCEECGDYMSQPQMEIPISVNVALTEAFSSEDLGISPELSDDLVVVISSQRYQLMNWLLAWDDLYRLCLMYLNDQEKTKNFVTELKYLEIDYSMFAGIKREPLDDYCGIEGGYEKYLDGAHVDCNNQEIISESYTRNNESVSPLTSALSLGSDGTEDYFGVNISSSTHSNPDVIKSLRLFRLPVKRSRKRDTTPPPVIPEKIQATDHRSADYSCYPPQSSPMNLSVHAASDSNSPPSTWHNPVNAKISCPESEPVPHTSTLTQEHRHVQQKAFYNNCTSTVTGNAPQNRNRTATVTRAENQSDLQYGAEQRRYLYSQNNIEDNVSQLPNVMETNPFNAHDFCDTTTTTTNTTATTTNNTTDLIQRGLPSGFSNVRNMHNLGAIFRNRPALDEWNRLLLSPTECRPYYLDCWPSSTMVNDNNNDVSDRSKFYNTMNFLARNRQKPVTVPLHTVATFDGNASYELKNVDGGSAGCTTRNEQPFTYFSTDDCQRAYDWKFLYSGLPEQRNDQNDAPSTSINPMHNDDNLYANLIDDDNASTEEPSSSIENEHITISSISRRNIAEDDNDNVAKLSTVDANSELNTFIYADFDGGVDTTKERSRSDSSNYCCIESVQSNVTDYALVEPTTSTKDDCIEVKKKKPKNPARKRAKRRKRFYHPPPKTNLEQYLNKLRRLGAKRVASQLLLKAKKKITHALRAQSPRGRKSKRISSARRRKRNLKLSRREMALLKQYQLNNEPIVLLERIELGKYEHRGTIKLSKLKKLNKERSENKINYPKRDKRQSTSPLQHSNPKVMENLVESEMSDRSDKDASKYNIHDAKIMNAHVVLDRLDLDKIGRSSLNPFLANVPGLGDLQMIRPSSVDRIVQVVQVTGSRGNGIPPTHSHSQTSTQVTPHIQRIGQPRMDKPESSESSSCPASPMPASTTTTTTIATTTTCDAPRAESSALINILSQQIIRPGNQINCVTTRQRSNAVFNIFSHQIIKPADSLSSPSSSTCTNTTTNTTSSTAELTANNVQRVISGGEQIVGVINPITSASCTPPSDQSHILRLLCKSSDGKLIPVLSSNKVVQVALAQSVTTTTTTTTTSTSTTNLNLDEHMKRGEECAETLPKFQQAFGKPAYQNNSVNSDYVTINNETEFDKGNSILRFHARNSATSLNMQSVQGGVIYTRQVPVGQTINFIPPGRGQLFRIATSSTEQISLVKETVIHSKMSALLAAALQTNKRPSETTEIETFEESRVTVTSRPALVQNARILTKPVIQIPSNVIRNTPQPNLSSTTLEQLREFDMVYKQVKERSSGNLPADFSPQSENNQQISVTYQGKKINCTPVVVVSSYCNSQSVTSPALSVTSQGSSSPCVTPSPSGGLTKSVSKTSKVKIIKNAVTHTSKGSPTPKPQQKPQEDEHTTQRIFDILAEYAEQLRNSPDLNNKPAPRRRSNPPTNPSPNTKRKKNSSKKTGQTSNSVIPDEADDTTTLGSEDSSCGLVQTKEEEQLTTSLSESTDCCVSSKQLILSESTANQGRNFIIADSSVGEALKMANTAVLVPGNYIMPVSMVKSGQQIAVVSSGSKILATLPARSGPNMLLFQSFLNQTRKHTLPTIKYSPVQPISGIARITTSTAAITATPITQNIATANLGQSVAFQKITHMDGTVNSYDTELLLAIAQPQQPVSPQIHLSQKHIVLEQHNKNYVHQSEPQHNHQQQQAQHTHQHSPQPQKQLQLSNQQQHNYQQPSPPQYQQQQQQDPQQQKSPLLQSPYHQLQHAQSQQHQQELEEQQQPHAPPTQQPSQQQSRLPQQPRQQQHKLPLQHQQHKPLLQRQQKSSQPEHPEHLLQQEPKVPQQQQQPQQQQRKHLASSQQQMPQPSLQQQHVQPLVPKQQDQEQQQQLSSITTSRGLQEGVSKNGNAPKYDENKKKSPAIIADITQDNSNNVITQKTNHHFEKVIVNTPIATSVIAQTSSIVIKEEVRGHSSTHSVMTLNLNTSESTKDTTTKIVERVQSVLVSTGTSNGPMLSHTPPHYEKQTHSSASVSKAKKGKFFRTDRKKNNGSRKAVAVSAYCKPGKNKKRPQQRLNKEFPHIHRKHAALERELRLQKSLSEECEDLGVDEPSTSDLFPEADLLFDSNHSPSYDHPSHDIAKRASHNNDPKVKGNVGLFCDVEPIRNEYYFDPTEEYQNAPMGLRDHANGQVSNQRDKITDHTLLRTSTSKSDAPTPSPIFRKPNAYPSSVIITNPSPVIKCKYNLSNTHSALKKKPVERIKNSENWDGSLGDANVGREAEYNFDEDDRTLIKEHEECANGRNGEASCISVRGGGRGGKCARKGAKKMCTCNKGSIAAQKRSAPGTISTPFHPPKKACGQKKLVYMFK